MISKITFTKIELLLIIVLNGIIAIPLSILPFVPIFRNLSIIILMAIFIYRKNKNLHLSIFYSILTGVLVISVTNVSEIAIKYILHAFKGTWINLLVDYFSYLMTFLICFFIAKYLGDLFEKNLKLLSMDLKNKFSLYIIFGVIITLLLFYVNVFLSDDIVHTVVISINSILLLLYFIFLISAVYMFTVSMRKNLEVAHKQELFDQLQNYTNNIENLYTEMKKFRHDYINIFSALYGYIESNDMNGIKHYFNEAYFH